MAPPVVSQNATLHALTERLASHTRMNPLMGMPTGFPSALSSQAMAAAANAYRQPAPPPQLPHCPIYTRHQDQGLQDVKNPDGVVMGDGKLRCPKQRQWGAPNEHGKQRSGALSEEEMNAFIGDMGTVMRREFDCWVEQCWTEAFHYLFTRTLPTLLIQLIMSGSSPSFLRRQIVHAGIELNAMFEDTMRELLYEELEMRLRGERPSLSDAAARAPQPPSLMPGGPPAPQPVSEVGVCFHNLLHQHDPDMVEDDHGLCLCHLTTCTTCFTSYAKGRKGAYSLLPWNLSRSPVADEWSGGIESEAQARARIESLRPRGVPSTPIPEGKGFIKNPKPAKTDPAARPPPLFPHPQMTDVLAVEEHLRWRLKEMGASDPAVEARYGPCTNSPAAVEGISLPDQESSENGDATTVLPKGQKIMAAKGMKRKAMIKAGGKGGAQPKKDGSKAGKQCYLPKEWIDAEPRERNMAIILTFRHFVKLLHQTTIAASPFSYNSYARDIEELAHVHPIAMYRRIAEPGQQRQILHSGDLRVWVDCMDKWGEEIAVKERTRGNKLVNEEKWADAIEAYSRGISLDPKKTILYTNRAIAFNNLKRYEEAEADCKHILGKDGKNGKAYYQRGWAREGLLRWRDALNDFYQVKKLTPNGDNESVNRHIEICKAHIAKMPKQSMQDALDF